MSEGERRKPGPRDRVLVERMRAAAERESIRARAREWRDRTPQEKLDIAFQLMELARLMVLGRGRPVQKAPLPTERMLPYDRRA